MKGMKTERDKMLTYINNARSEVEQATILFNELTDSSAIDYASYNLLAAKAPYSNLIQIAKEQGFTIGGDL